MAKKYVQCNTLYLAGSGVIPTATSIILTSFTDIYGNVLTMTDFGDVGYITLEPDTTNEESATFTGVTANANGTYALTGVKTVLAKSPYTQTSGLIRTHSGGTKVVVSDTTAFWDTFANKYNDESIQGKYTFLTAQRPTMTADTDTATATDLVTFGQLSRQAISGASNASTSVKGIVEIATQAEVDAKTTTGGTGALLVPTPDTTRSTLLSDYKADTGAANAYVITPVPAITAYTVGQIFSFKATNANTTTSTLNVNGLGVKTIKKLGGGTDLVSGDIIANQVVLVEYDGTNFQMLNPVGTAVSNLLFGDGSDGDVTISTNTSLSRDMFYNNLTVNTGVTLNPSGYRIFVKNALVVSGTGLIARNANNGSGATPGAALADGTIKGGVAGIGNPGAGNAGLAGNSVTNAIGGAGGGGGSAGFGGGAAGGATATSTPPTSPTFPLNLSALIGGVSPLMFPLLTASAYTGGGSGGGAANQSGSGTVGGSGGGGAIVIVAASSVTLAANDSIQAKGGNSGNATGTNCGTGGGGGGGAIILVYKTFSGTALVAANAVAGGTPGTVSGGSGVQGSAGSTGNLYVYAIS